jgi:hypothetical protein
MKKEFEGKRNKNNPPIENKKILEGKYLIFWVLI